MTDWRKILSWRVYDPSWDTLSEDIKNILLQDRYDGNLYLGGTPITDLGNLQHVGGDLFLSRTPITNLGNLQRVGGDLSLHNTPIIDLGRLEYVGGYLNLHNTPIARMSEEERNEIVRDVEVRGEIIYER